MTHKPYILNLYKPKDMSSQDVVRKWKPKLRPYGKVGHFGTLDPFAEGVLMLGVGGGQRLNEYVHECLPKTYLAKGILGQETETGDLTVKPSQVDESDYIKDIIAKFDQSFIEEQLQEKFLGKYMQSPHKYSAAKFDGKPLHQWAREGVDIVKEQKERTVYKIEVVKFDFPHLWIRFEVSSGTYIRTLFSDCAGTLGTLGVLEHLIREQVGGCKISNALTKESWDDEDIKFLDIAEVLPFSYIQFQEKEVRLYSNGVKLHKDRIHKTISGELDFPYYWVTDLSGKIYGLAQIDEHDQVCSRVNYTF